MALCVPLIACGGGQATVPPSAAGSTAPPALAATPPTEPVATDAAAQPIRIPLSGAAPGAIVLDGGTAWVLTGEGGTLLEVDLEARREVRAIDVGFGATHLALPLPGVAAVGRFDDSGTGGYTVLVDLATGTLRPVSTGEVGSLDGAAGVAWVLEKADRLVKVDAATGEVIDGTSIDVGENVHVEVRWAGGAAWVGSDGLPLVRVDEADLADHQAIEIDEGIPFLSADDRLWGAGPSQLWALDPATSEVTKRITLERLIEILALDIDGDEAWIAARRLGYLGTVLSLDIATGEVVGEVAVDLPAAIRIAPDRVWVASYSTNELLGFAR